MSDSENSQNPDGGDNGNGHRQVLRSEREWRALLLRAERETARFRKFYEEIFAKSEEERGGNDDDRLDRCALAMGWHLSTDEPSDAAAEESEAALSSEEIFPESPSSSPEFPAVYSLHNLPESIAVSAIYGFICSRWNRLWKTPYAGKLSARTGFALEETLATAHRDLLLAIDAEDAMEFGLAICLTKNVHAMLNRHFAEMESVPVAINDEAYMRTVRELRCALMDLRDICLRILRDAREELEKARE